MDAGWYGDPGGGPGQRWWDGTGWSGDTTTTFDKAQFDRIESLLSSINGALMIIAGLAILGALGGLLLAVS